MIHVIRVLLHIIILILAIPAIIACVISSLIMWEDKYIENFLDFIGETFAKNKN